MSIHFLIFTNTCPQSTLYWPTITHITQTKLRWLININNSITAAQHFQKEKRKSHTTQPQDSLWEREWIRKIWERGSRELEREKTLEQKLQIAFAVQSRRRSHGPFPVPGGVTISRSPWVLDQKVQSWCFESWEPFVFFTSVARLSIAEIVFFLFWFWFL